MCIDARNAWKDLKNFQAILDSLPSSVDTQVLFLDAQETTLLQRFGETRRRHPLSTESIPLAEAIDRERELLEPISSSASLVLDTSQMTVYELRDAIKQRLLGNQRRKHVDTGAVIRFQARSARRCGPGIRRKNAAQSTLGKGVAAKERS